MNRTVEDKYILKNFCSSFCKVVEKHTKYIIVSGFVAIASGRARGTEDIDMIISKLKKEDFLRLHKELAKVGFVAMQSDDAHILYEDYLRDKLSIRYTTKNQLLPEMEVKFAKDTLDEYQLQTRVKLPLTGLDVWFSSINMNVAFKEELLKSPKDIEDARHLRVVYSELIDEKEIKKIKQMIKKHRLS